MKVDAREEKDGEGWFWQVKEDNGDHAGISGLGVFKSREEAIVAAMRVFGESMTLEGIEGPIESAARTWDSA